MKEECLENEDFIKGVPHEILKMLEYVRELEFSQEPDYI